MDLFSFTNYKQLLLHLIETHNPGERGKMRRIAEHLNVNPSYVSLVLNGDRDFSPEQIYTMAEYFQLSSTITDFLLLLNQKDRAGSAKLKKHFENKIEQIRKSELIVSCITPTHVELSDIQKAEYYSDGLYAAARVMVSIASYNTVEDLAKVLQTPLRKCEQIVEFLTKHQLIVNENGRLTRSIKNVYIPKTSPFIPHHHRNWRFKTVEHIPRMSEDDFFYTSLISISKEDSMKLKEMILEAIDKMGGMVSQTNPELMCCLSIDFYQPYPGDS